MRFSLRVLLALFVLAICVAAGVGHTRHVAVKRSLALDQLMESGVEVRYSSEQTFSTYWFGEVARPPVLSFEHSEFVTTFSNNESLFDFAHVPELKKLVLFNASNFSAETSKTLTNLEELEFHTRRVRSTLDDDDLVGSYAGALPVMPKLESLSVVGPPMPINFHKHAVEAPTKDVSSWEADGFQDWRGNGVDLETLFEKSPNLKKVNLALYEITPEAVSLLGSRSTLESVDLRICKPSAETYFELAKSLLAMPNLKELRLDFSQNKESDFFKHFWQELDSFETLAISNSKLELISLPGLVAFEVFDCPNLKKIVYVAEPFNRKSKKATLDVRRCENLRFVSCPLTSLHLEDCPRLVGDFNNWRQLFDQENSRKLFFKNVGRFKTLRTSYLDNLTVEGQLNVDEFCLEDFCFNPHERRKNKAGPPQNLLPNVVCKNWTLEHLSPEIIQLLEQNSPLDSLTLHVVDLGSVVKAERGWTPENISALYQGVSTKDLTLCLSKPVDSNCFEYLDQCEGVESLTLKAWGSLESNESGEDPALLDFVLVADGGPDFSLAARWKLKIPESVKVLSLPANSMNKEPEYLNFLAERYPGLTINYQ